MNNQLISPDILTSYFESRMDHYMDLLHQMVGINSFTANPTGVNQLGELTAQVFGALGFSAQQTQSTNPNFGKHLVIRRTGDRPIKIGLISHLDTVFPPDDEMENDFYWREEGDRLYGPGTVDIKGGTVVMYMMLDALKNLAPKILDDVSWAGLLNASEETIAWDFGDLVRAELGDKGAACLIFEGGKRDKNRFELVVARKGMAIYHIKVEGKASHAGSAHEQGANAIVELARVLDRVASFTDYDRFLTFNVGTVSGGTVTNRVPHFAEARVEMRTFDPKVFDHGVQSMMSLNEHSTVSSVDGFNTRVNVGMFHRTAPWPANPLTEGLFQVWLQAGQELGYDVNREERGGLSDGNLFWNEYPTLDGLGPSGGNAHCSERSPDGGKDQEFAARSSFVPKAMLNTTALVRLVEKIAGK